MTTISGSEFLPVFARTNLPRQAHSYFQERQSAVRRTAAEIYHEDDFEGAASKSFFSGAQELAVDA